MRRSPTKILSQPVFREKFNTALDEDRGAPYAGSKLLLSEPHSLGWSCLHESQQLTDAPQFWSKRGRALPAPPCCSEVEGPASLLADWLPLQIDAEGTFGRDVIASTTAMQSFQRLEVPGSFRDLLHDALRRKESR